MGSGHRPGRRGRGREGFSSPQRAERELVLPGQEVGGPGLRPGPGTYRIEGKIYASVLGLLSVKPPEVRVVALSGRYVPHPGDMVVGTVADVQSTFWLLDIGAPRWAPLHMTGTPWKIELGETGQYLHVGDSVVVQVEAIENTGRIGVTMNGDELGKLEGGTIIAVTPARIPRIIGRGGSMIDTIRGATGTKIVVGQNGRVWVDGPPDGVLQVRHALELIEDEGQRRGLTSRIEDLLRAGPMLGADGQTLPARPPHEEPPDDGGAPEMDEPSFPDPEP